LFKKKSKSIDNRKAQVRKQYLQIEHKAIHPTLSITTSNVEIRSDEGYIGGRSGCSRQFCLATHRAEMNNVSFVVSFLPIHEQRSPSPEPHDQTLGSIIMSNVELLQPSGKAAPTRSSRKIENALHLSMCA
jgi:hypothetical protein